MNPSPEQIRKPVPAMLEDRGSGPRCLFRVPIPEAGTSIMVAKTDDGYVGLPPACPHASQGFVKTGLVDPHKRSIFCQAHGVTYSLDTGEEIENLTDPYEEGGKIDIFEVVREGDEFVFEYTLVKKRAR